ncbi:hypothetical protein COT65_01025 [Candidatus Shapirobacteria bacterium CG09_land_8_20_14_0_10_47_13]|uniref:histidine kinase n=1 Tax=Candidatus Shapirobacteria bacterium CG09_land_8_20_14_0_10_47_13 TaxID=1974481 RepID=A0A2H0WN23_9BACT|nr:MAG: hypothetical protein COT65_01025 [Candidatus Shapirobacteria bacterium CG09_land_8_20_14_0_10_47_13]
MFHSARVKLTAWYLLIIMVISIFFSAAIYRALTFELDRFERVQRLRIEGQLPGPSGPPSPFRLDPDLVEETKDRLKMILTIIDLVILAGAATAGYFLAGRTLKPIKEMVDEQGRFITDASHELRTPLTALKSEIEVNLRAKKLTLAQAQKLLKSNLEEVDKMEQLSNYLLALSRYQDGQGNPAFTSVNLQAVAEKAWLKIMPLAKAKKVKIEKQLQDVQVKGNEISLIELAVILLDNAIKYSRPGGKIILTTGSKNKKAILAVQDFGAGIKPAELPYIFDRFYRADSSRSKERAVGYGLGLAIAKNIVETHRGRLAVASQPQRGSLFQLILTEQA